MELRQSILPQQDSPEYIFDDLQKLQSSFKGETELIKMFSRMFEMQIQQTTVELMRDYTARHLKYRTDFDYFQWQVKDENLQAEI